MTLPSSRARRFMMLRACALAVVAVFTTPAFAANWPDPGKPINLVVGFPPGGGVDTLARAISQALSEKIGDSVIVQNRPGAGGLIATEYAARAAPDGYTLYIATPGSFTIWPGLRKLNYDPAKDFSPVSVLVTMPNLLVTGATTSYEDVLGLIKAAKSPGAQLNYASGGVGTMGQIAAEQFNVLAGLQMTHIPYKGTAPALTDVIGGTVPFTFSDPSAKSMIDSGKLKVLAVTTKKRSPLFPDVPTMAEAGVPGYDLMNWYGLVAPAGTPAEVIERLNAALVEIMNRSEIRQRLESAGMEATSSTPQEFNELMATERAKWAALIAKVGMKAE